VKPIITLTLNPALDQLAWVGRVESDRKLRAERCEFEPGGGGINVARAASALGAEATAIFLAAGHTGQMLAELLEARGVTAQPIETGGLTRVNLNVFETDSDRGYRFVMPGTPAGEGVMSRLADVTRATAEQAEYLVVSGSFPPGLDAGEVADLCGRLRQAGKRIIVDTSGKALHTFVERGAFLIKPNLRELRDLTGSDIEGDEEVVSAARELVQGQTVEAVVVSLGGGGAVLVTGENDVRVHAPTVKIRSRVGAGDSMVGGMTVALARGWSLPDAVRYGVSAGASAVSRSGTQLCDADQTDELYESISGEESRKEQQA
jgi:6-phosphofructokinase 2